jgi:hypothetical protein
MSEKPIVIQLQAECLDKNTSVSDLLRKALVIAKKLNSTEIEEWLRSEMKGYTSDPLPEYRILHGQIMYHNPYNGSHWPINFKSDREQQIYSERKNGGPIAEIEALIASSTANGIFGMEIPHQMAMKMVTMFDLPSKPFFQIQKTALIYIVDAVRNRILDWTLEMEAKGILGENLSFSKEEKTAASTVVFNIENMNHSQIQHASPHASQSFETTTIQFRELEELSKSIGETAKNIELDDLNKSQINLDLETLRMQIKAPKPNSGIIKESLLSLQRIFENSIGGAIGSGIVVAIGKYLSQLP